MIVTRLPLLFLFASYCLTTTAQNKPAAGNTSFKQKDTAYWVDNFRQLRDALYQKDKAKTKAFFDFPVINEGNEIWYVAYSNDEKAMAQLDTTVNPFTEKDFDKYYSMLFSKAFVQCLLKIKTAELYKKGETESPDLKDDATTYKLFAKYDKEDNTIQLNFSITTIYKEPGSNEVERGESNILYYFSVLNNGHIKFKQLRIAG